MLYQTADEWRGAPRKRVLFFAMSSDTAPFSSSRELI